MPINLKCLRNSSRKSKPDRGAFKAQPNPGVDQRAGTALEIVPSAGRQTPFPVSINVMTQTELDNKSVRLLWLLQDVRERQEAENLRLMYSRLKSCFFGLIEAFAHAMEMKYLQNAGHQRRVAQLAVAIAREMDFSPSRVKGIKVAALLHDIGKIAVPTEILSKPGVISHLEAEFLKSHCLKAADIIPEAKILAVADVLDAMIHSRLDAPAQSLDAALDEIDRQRGILYDAEVVTVCLSLFREKKFKVNEDINLNQEKVPQI
jgi:HD-GYP domain-containing protein (c-di-GMP phosphodiesterase class II)